MPSAVAEAGVGWNLPLAEFILAQEEQHEHQTIDLKDIVKELKPKIIQWIQLRGTWVDPHEVQGHTDLVLKIGGLLGDTHLAQEQCGELKRVVDQKSSQIQLAKKTMLERLNKANENPDVYQSKCKHLDEWAVAKMAPFEKELQEMENKVQQLDATISDLILELLQKLQGPQAVDPELDVLMKELDSEFSHLSLEPSRPTTSTPEMTATSEALSRVAALQDGPEKSAMMAVLSVASSVEAPSKAEK